MLVCKQLSQGVLFRAGSQASGLWRPTSSAAGLFSQYSYALDEFETYNDSPEPPQPARRTASRIPAIPLRQPSAAAGLAREASRAVPDNRSGLARQTCFPACSC